MGRYLWCIFVLVLFVRFTAHTQNVYFPVYHYGSENGLVHLNVLSVQQDKNKILYAVTQGGVYEYAGQMFQRKQEYTELKNIRNIDFNDTTVWLIHREKGLYYVRHKHIYPFFSKSPFTHPSDKIILHPQYCYNYTDQISVEIYDYKNNIYSNDSLVLKDNSNQAFCIQSIRHTLLVGRKKGLYILENSTQKLLPQYAHIPVFSMFHDSIHHQLYIGSSGKILIADDQNYRIQKEIPVKIDLLSKSKLFLFQMERNISKIVVDKYSRIWFCTQPDDNLYLLENNQLYDVLNILNIMPTLINDIYLDNFNTLWIATFNDGLYQIASTYWQSLRFSAYQRLLNIKQIEKTRSSIFWATTNGLFYSDTAHFQKFVTIIPPDNFFNTEIYSLQTYQNALYATNLTDFDTKTYNIQNNPVTILPFKCLAVKDAQHCFVSDITHNVLIYHIKTKRITDTIYKPSDFKLNIHHLFFWNNELFISTNKGLFVWNGNTQTSKIYLEYQGVQKVKLLNNQLYILSENKIYTYPSLQVQCHTEPYHLVTITDIEQYKDYYFISSEEGLLLLNKQWNYVNFFGRKDGLVSNVINDILIFNQTLVVATDKGISSASINNLLQTNMNLSTPQVSYLVLNTDTIPFHNTHPLVFDKNTQDIYFHLVCPNFNPLTKVQYQYALNQSEWINFENPSIHFSSLPGGSYTLKIRASTDNIHFTEPLIISFNKELKINEKEWFWEVLVLITTMVLTFVILRIREVEKKKSTLKLKNIQQMNLLKHQAMNAILSPHFIFNSLTGIQNYILKHDVEKASDYLSKFSRLIRMIIEKASQPTISLHDELKRLQFYLELEKERFGDKFDFQIHIDEKINLETTEIPNMILQPYLENAILHGILPKKEKGHIAVSFQLKNNTYLEIQIEDDGIGILKGKEKKSKHHKSLAMQTIAEILQINTQLLQKQQTVQIIDKSTLNKHQSGTLVKILIEL